MIRYQTPASGRRLRPVYVHTCESCVNDFTLALGVCDGKSNVVLLDSAAAAADQRHREIRDFSRIDTGKRSHPLVRQGGALDIACTVEQPEAVHHPAHLRKMAPELDDRRRIGLSQASCDLGL